MGVAADAPVTVEFDRPVVTVSVRAGSRVNRPIPSCDLDAAFTAGPLAPCRIVWLNGDTGFTLLHPRAIFAPSTSYTFTLAGGISDPSGVVNSVDHHWNDHNRAGAGDPEHQPAGRRQGVPVDPPIAVSFSTTMAADATEAAITLTHRYPGHEWSATASTRAVSWCFPEAILQAGVTYRLTVAKAATDSDHQPLVDRGDLRRSRPPACRPVLTWWHSPAAADEGATTVLVSPLAPAATGEPISTEAVLVAPRCPHATGCGSAADRRDRCTPTQPRRSHPGDVGWRWSSWTPRSTAPTPVLVVINPATGSVVTSFADSSLPSWSPDGSTLAFSRAGRVSFFNPSTAVLTSLPAGDPMVAPAIWSPLGEQLVARRRRRVRRSSISSWPTPSCSRGIRSRA